MRRGLVPHADSPLYDRYITARREEDAVAKAVETPLARRGGENRVLWNAGKPLLIIVEDDRLVVTGKHGRS